MGRNSQVAISGRNPGPLHPESGGSEFEEAVYRCETSRNAVTLVFPTLTHDALCFQPLVKTAIGKPFRIDTCRKQQKIAIQNLAGGVARAPWEASSLTEPGCPRSPAFGDLGDHGPKPAGSRPIPIAVGSPRSFRPIQTTMRAPLAFADRGHHGLSRQKDQFRSVPHKRPVTRIRHRGRAQPRVKPLFPAFSPISCPFSHLRRTVGLPVISRLSLYWIYQYPKRRPPPSGFAGKETPVAPSEACRSQNRMLNQCHRFFGCAATKPCISWAVRNNIRQIGYLPRPSWPKPLKRKYRAKTTPPGGIGASAEFITREPERMRNIVASCPTVTVADPRFGIGSPVARLFALGPTDSKTGLTIHPLIQPILRFSRCLLSRPAKLL